MLRGGQQPSIGVLQVLPEREASRVGMMEDRQGEPS
jgi:hypothetical protein